VPVTTSTLPRAPRDSEGEPVDIGVLLVARTRTRLRALARLVEAPGYAIAGEARDADEAEVLAATGGAAVVLLDLDLDAGGLEVIEQVMAARATPIVVYGAAAEQAQAALAAGAVDVVGPLDAPIGTDAHAVALRRHLAVASRAPVITHPRARLRGRSAPPRSAVICLGASTGGPPALATILGGLPADLDAVVVVVQHMAEGFVEGLARWLDRVCPLPVRIAVDGERAASGVVYLAPAGGNLIVSPGLRLHVVAPDPGQFHVPSVDATFLSVADVAGPRAIAVLLTGMGRDGAAGMAAMAAAGAVTLAQDEGSAVVWGMPGAAVEAGSVSGVLPLDGIADGVVQALSGGAA
jgi:two-component system chemotaxis response regulator CheB